MASSSSSTTDSYEFINLLKPHQIKDLQKAIYLSEGYVNSVDREHVDPVLTLEQLATMKGLPVQDGKFLFFKNRINLL